MHPLISQLRIPGTPIPFSGSIDRNEMTYLLPPLHPLEEAAFLQEEQEQRARIKVGRFAVERPLDLDPGGSGTWESGEGIRIWRALVISPGARSLGLVFHPFRLEKGVRLMVYDPAMAHVKGAFTDLNNKSNGVFAVGHVPGDQVVVELQVPGNLDSYGELALRSVSHAFRPVAVRETQDGRFGLSGDCEIDIACSEGDAWQSEKRSVVRIFTSTQYCTGVVINNTAMDGDPLILTAKHCIDREYYANESVIVFNYESPSCFGEDGSIDDISRSGAELLAVGDSIDFSLIRLSETLPDDYKVSFAGWDLGQPDDGTTVIHHPEGDVKKISFDFEAPEATSDPSDIPSSFWEFLPHSFWWVKQWDVGSTEPGSSGSPLFNRYHRVMGLLSFGGAQCGDSLGYDAENDRVIFSKEGNEDDFFTRLSVAWDYDPDPAGSLKSWLDPLGTGQTLLDTFDPLSSEPPVTEPGQLLKLWPNPAGRRVFLQALTELPGTAEIRICDPGGRLLRMDEADLRYPYSLDLTGLSPGIYLLIVRSGDFREGLRLAITK